VTVFRETQKIQDGPVIAEYQIAIAKDEMALTTIIVNVTVCAQQQDREDDATTLDLSENPGRKP
jgi:hypothetical protein